MSSCLSNGTTLLFSNGDTTVPGLGFTSSPYAAQYIAVRFTVTDSVSIAVIEVAGRYGGTPEGDDFSVAILADGSDLAPGQLLEDYNLSHVPSTRVPLPFVDSYMHSMNLPSAITLGAGTYWLAVANASIPYWSWLNSYSTGTPSAFSNTFFTNGYLPLSDDPVPFIFSLQGSVIPEPSTLALGGLGLCLLARRKRC